MSTEACDECATVVSLFSPACSRDSEPVSAARRRPRASGRLRGGHWKQPKPRKPPPRLALRGRRCGQIFRHPPDDDQRWCLPAGGLRSRHRAPLPRGAYACRSSHAGRAPSRRPGSRCPREERRRCRRRDGRLPRLRRSRRCRRGNWVHRARRHPLHGGRSRAVAARDPVFASPRHPRQLQLLLHARSAKARRPSLRDIRRCCAFFSDPLAKCRRLLVDQRRG
jgi:hypothetical protein